MKRLTLILLVSISCYPLFSQYNKGIKIEPVLKTDTTSIGQKIELPQNGNNEITILRITIEPGQSTGWHKHDLPVFAYVLEGTLSVEIENHSPKQFITGTSFSEVINTYHNGSNLGNTNLVLLAFYIGKKDLPLSVKK